MTKFYKILFLTMVFTSTLISISSYSWMAMWIGLEINVLSIIPILNSHKNKLSSEASIKYFITQSIASSVILLSIILTMMNTSFYSKIDQESWTMIVMNSSLLMKMGMAPFHFWFPEVLEGLNWMNCMLMLTWQKIAPMVLFMLNTKFKSFMTIVIIISMVISGLMAFNQISLRKIMAYSSINHMGWMISAMIFLQTTWMFYFIVYSLMTINIIIILNSNKIFFLNQLMQNLNSSPSIKIFFIVNFLSLAGIPPFIGFLPKWLTIQTMVQNSLYILPFIMIICTMMMIYVYINISISSLLIKSASPNWLIYKTNEMSNSSSYMNFVLITSLIMVTLTFNSF
uniref:NADH-ubiquinone oxidoreductase chain 2 n=1 Tax=Bicellonychia lividipennis TaxID=1176499 RepID=A0A158V186_9COLE|nr:NADH dehydrogenase subunit 2 [Bicellonychia lividipennis]AIQ80135.1 NADH dehydrogenase subunit 2 [Bicellonychia lividipennis]